jgi:hypothetical protein
MSRNHVSKMFVGVGIANVTASAIALAALTEGQIIAFDFDNANAADNGLTSTSTNLGFARGTAVLGEPILAGPIPIDNIREANNNPYQAPVNQISTLTVATTPSVGKSAIFKVVYHDNLSIIPNQIKNTTIAVVADAANTASTTTFAAAIAAEFNKQTSELGGNLFVTVTSAAAIVTMTGITLLTQSNYNGIDRPETLVFEIGIPEEGDGTHGTYAVALTNKALPGQGDTSKIAWLEEQHMGRLGYADRRMWNNTKKYQSQLVAGVTAYETLVINGDDYREGDMQGLRANPVGVVVAAAAAGQALIEADLLRAGIVPVVIPANV